MIADFSVGNFYSIRTKQTISFVPTIDKHLSDTYLVEVTPNIKLLRLGIVYGANASGKTKLLQALDFFRKLLTVYPSSRTDAIDYYPFLLDSDSKTTPSKMQMNFYLEGERYCLDLEFDRQHILKEQLSVYTSVRPSMLYARSYIKGSDSTRVEFGKALQLNRHDQDIIYGNTLNNCSVLAAFGQSNVEKTRLNTVYEWINHNFSVCINPTNTSMDFLHKQLQQDEDKTLHTFIKQFLQKSDFNISEFDLSPDGKSITFHHQTASGDGTLPEALESNGTLRYMSIAALLKHLLYNNQFMMIDELETSLHYELISYFLRFYLNNDTGTSQMLIATHDINLLKEDFLRRDVVWFTDKNEDAETELVRLSQLGLHKNLSPYNAYLQGKLVKLPFTSETYIDK